MLAQSLGTVAASVTAAIAPAPAPAPPERAKVVQIRSDSVTLRTRPRGKVVTRLGRRTEFGTRTKLHVVRRRGKWLGVISTQRPNGRLGWIRQSPGVWPARDPRVSIVVDRSARRLTLLRGSKVLMRMSVGLGRPGSPTPTGRFAVTDKLAGSSFSSAAYGCCILALTGKQTNLPGGWTGGNRLAIHGSGRIASAGCVVARDAPLRRLMRRVAVGTKVTVKD